MRKRVDLPLILEPSNSKIFVKLSLVILAMPTAVYVFFLILSRSQISISVVCMLFLVALFFTLAGISVVCFFAFEMGAKLIIGEGHIFYEGWISKLRIDEIQQVTLHEIVSRHRRVPYMTVRMKNKSSLNVFRKVQVISDFWTFLIDRKLLYISITNFKGYYKDNFERITQELISAGMNPDQIKIQSGLFT